MEREYKHVKYRVTTTEIRSLTEKGWEVPRMALGRHPTKVYVGVEAVGAEKVLLNTTFLI
jgi:hypothetical protein